MSKYGPDEFARDCETLGYTREQVAAFTARDLQRVGAELSRAAVDAYRDEAEAIAAKLHRRDDR